MSDDEYTKTEVDRDIIYCTKCGALYHRGDTILQSEDYLVCVVCSNLLGKRKKK